VAGGGRGVSSNSGNVGVVCESLVQILLQIYFVYLMGDDILVFLHSDIRLQTGRRSKYWVS
jgi:hypothetical protein